VLYELNEIYAVRCSRDYLQLNCANNSKVRQWPHFTQGTMQVNSFEVKPSACRGFEKTLSSSSKMELRQRENIFLDEHSLHKGIIIIAC
jgi:hypothetical protein